MNQKFAKSVTTRLKSIQSKNLEWNVLNKEINVEDEDDMLTIRNIVKNTTRI